METPTHSFGQVSVGWASHGCGFRVFCARRDEGRVHRNREPPEEEGGEISEGGEGGPGPLRMFFSFWCGIFSWVVSFVFPYWWMGSPEYDRLGRSADRDRKSVV